MAIVTGSVPLVALFLGLYREKIERAYIELVCSGVCLWVTSGNVAAYTAIKLEHGNSQHRAHYELFKLKPEFV